MAAKEWLTESLDAWLEENNLNILVEISDVRTLSFLLGGKDRFPSCESVKTVFGQVLCQPCTIKLGRAVIQIRGF